MNEKPKILIADDSEINRALLKEILGDGYDYLEAEDGAAAVELMRQRTDISLLLLDLMMPGMDGFDVLRVMKYHTWLDEIPVIVISAAEDTANIERAYDLGVADYIRRPFERIMILRRVKNILMLYAKQKRLTRLVTDQVYEKEHNSVLMISILSHVVEFRNSESGLHVLHIRTLTDLLLHQLAGKTDRYQLDESDISLISTASALHDLGKIVIPTEILNKPGRLTAEQAARLEKLGIAWKQRMEQAWERGYAAAREYRGEYGNLMVPVRYRDKNGFALGEWIVYNRQRFLGNNLSTDRAERLEALGMVWDTVQDIWEQSYCAAVQYWLDHGTLEVPVKYTTPEGVALGVWLGSQRAAYKAVSYTHLTLPTNSRV